jgi:hypothetical protein
MTYLVTTDYDFTRFVAPRLPNATEEYDPRYLDQLNNILRLYFNQIDNVFGQLNASIQTAVIKVPYLAVQDNVSHTVTANTANAMTFDTVDYSNNCSLVSTSQFTVTYAGIYNLQFSTQFQNTDTQLHDVSIWLRKNGADLTGSTGFVSVPNEHGGTPGHSIVGWNFYLSLAANDYIQIYWSTTDAAVTIEAYPVGTSPTRPSTASNVATLTFVSSIP